MSDILKLATSIEALGKSLDAHTAALIADTAARGEALNSALAATGKAPKPTAAKPATKPAAEATPEPAAEATQPDPAPAATVDYSGDAGFERMKAIPAGWLGAAADEADKKARGGKLAEVIKANGGTNLGTIPEGNRAQFVAQMQQAINDFGASSPEDDLLGG